uniref:DUF1295 domain-containing protein n=1 Tax=Ignisphaera aggregans TaxID=334771 RepID=A0A7C2ZM28_9CREN
MDKNVGKKALVVSVILSAVFTYAFLYVTQAVPVLLDHFLRMFFPEVPLDMWSEIREAMLPYGYVALAVVIMLVIVGIVSKWVRLSKLGALALYIPTFGYFALAMFLLAGAGILRIIWLPIIQPRILMLGNAVLLPVEVLTCFLADTLGLGTPYAVGSSISLVIRALGMLVFFLGVTAWLYGRYQGLKVVDFWIYKYSRHPQYLGFIIWSYGLLAQVAYKIYVRGAFADPPTLIWLIMIAILTLAALKEEENMVKTYGNAYLSYATRTPFYFPLPKPLMRLLTVPHKLVKYEVGSWKRGGLVILVYLSIIIMLSYLIYS